MARLDRFTKDQLLERASERVVWVMRHMYDEKGSSHSRLLDNMLMPDRLITVGRSHASHRGDQYREHVVPCVRIIRRGHAMIRAGVAPTEIAAFIRNHTKIVLISREEAEHLNRKDRMNLKKKMPRGWKFGDDIYARLSEAGIAWSFDPEVERSVPADQSAEVG